MLQDHFVVGDPDNEVKSFKKVAMFPSGHIILVDYIFYRRADRIGGGPSPKSKT